MQNKIGNILIVGRNLELLDELYSIFRNKCEIITSATNTQRAIIRAKLLDFSLFIIDATQADNKSLEFMKEIQEVKKPALVKFIILYDGSEVVNNELLKSEFDFDIQKLPVDGNEISWRIDKLLDAKKPNTPKAESIVEKIEEKNSSIELNVLVADDNMLNQRVIAMFLKKMNLAHQLASNGQEAIDAYTAVKFTHILMDVNMPVLDGIEATKQIRKLQAENPLKIIAITADKSTESVQNCLDAGMDEIMTKPFTLEVLQKHIS